MVAEPRQGADNQGMKIRHGLAFALLGVACSDAVQPDPLTPSGLPRSAAQAIVGTWTLASWNANPMPAKYETHFGNDAVPDSVLRIAGGSVTLNDDASFTRTTDWRVEQMDGTAQRTYSVTQQGSYTGSVSGGAVTLNLFGPVRMQIGVAGNTMSAKFAVDQSVGPPVVLGDVWRYQK